MWILGSLCDSLQEQVVTTPGNAKALWDHLKNLFHDNKDARAINLDNELRSIKIEKMTVNEYCTKIQAMANRLKNLDCEVSEKNMVIFTVNGLDSRFATLAEIIRHREPLPTFETVRNMLLLKESSFNDDSTSTTFESSSSSLTIIWHLSSNTKAGLNAKNNTQHATVSGQNNWGCGFGTSPNSQARRLVHTSNSIPVTNTGHSIIPSHHRPLHLHNVLVTPDIIKNLISVRQFTRDNNCTIEFDVFGFSVKDFLTRHILLRCDSSDDLYPVTKSSDLPVAFVSTSSFTWHQRLGHPGDEVLRSLTSRCFISCNKEKSSHVCHACQLGKHVKLPFHSSDSIVTKCFDIIHSDLWTSPIAQQPPTSPPGIPSPIEPQPARTHSMVTRSQSGIVKPIELKNGTWILVPRPSNVNLVRSMWLFKHKFHADGTLSHYKACLVANGSKLQHGVDFDETFSPVVQSATIRIVLSLVVSRQWPIHQLDVKNAFLNGDLSETVYMHQPPGFVDSRYATRAGFSPSRCDSSLFIYTQGSQVAYLLIYVDDIILTAYSLVLLQHIVDSFNKEFDMTDLGALNYFLGIC
ncbi:ribonuclease H-like domain-containing protein [Tanacetum coccineum]